ncbi:ester cyclase [Halorubrum rubrum]|uniref:Ester cyclase n=1 Tax=Halorubrum rubrum TaxID=1126240 RepID=A0ABD5R2B2_9EURY|nr:ester cyclase [Halorubrum rubrum]
MTVYDSTVETNQAIVRRIPTEIFDDGDVGLVDELFAEDFVGHVPPVPGELHGPEGFEGVVRAFRTGFPDLRHPEIHLVGDGDTVVARLVGVGTHEGEFLGIQPTGEQMETTAMEMYRLDDGVITEAWINVDMLGILQQLGVVQDL